MQTRAMGNLKPTQLMKEVIYIKTNRLGFIPQIHMQGPIITPIPVTREVVKEMIVAGIEVFEVYKDKLGNRQVRLLTLQNVYPGEGEEGKPEEPDDNKDGEQKPQVPTSGVVQQEPVQPVSFKGVSIPEENHEEKPEKIVENAEEKKEEPIQTMDLLPTKDPEEEEGTVTEKTEEKKDEDPNSKSQNKPNSKNKDGKRSKNKNK